MNAEQTALEKSSLFLFRDGEMGIVVEKKKKSKKWRILNIDSDIPIYEIL